MKSLKTLLLSVVSLFALCGIAAQTPDWLWAQSAGGTDQDRGLAIALDSSGNTYVTGYFRGTVTFFGNCTLTGSANDTIFLAKLDNSGNCIWVKSAPMTGNASCRGSGIAVDNAGNVYVTGTFSGSVTFGSTTLISPGAYGGSPDIFVAKLDSAGNWLWAKGAGATYSDKGNGIALDSSGNVYVTGVFQGTVSFGSNTLTSSGFKAFVAKLDNNGNWLWAKQAEAANNSFGSGIAVDGSANVYLIGTFGGTPSWGIFAAKLDSDGNWLWAKNAGGAWGDGGYGIAVDSSANVYVTGMFQGTVSFGSIDLTSSGLDIFVAKLDTNGNWLWAKNAGGTGEDCGYSIALDGSANIYLTGYFEATATFGSAALTSSGDFDIYVAKLDGAGNWLWTEKAGGTNQDIGWGIAVDSNANAYLTGHFGGSNGTAITATFGDITLTSNQRWDIFIAKFGIAVPVPKVPQNLLIQKSGSDITLSWDAVTQDTGGQPLTPDEYKIEVSENNADWADLGTVPSPGYTHTAATTGNGPKFYRVRAVKD